jgi:predicted metal-binding membrane protein
MRSSPTCIFRPTVSSAPDLISRILRHERLVVAGGIALLVGLCWWFVASGAGMGDGMAAMQPPPFTAVLLMWWLMMAAMMLPSAAPAILLYARVRQTRSDPAVAQSWLFLAGYLALWLLFSILAVAAQRLLTGPSMALGNRRAEGTLLILAGLYQLSPLKAACLGECRSPAQFISRHWRPGWAGALRLGLLHGAYCVGCCWVLMLLLFVGGVMNLLWVVALAAIVAIEKLAPGGQWFARLSGCALIAWGLVILLG